MAAISNASVQELVRKQRPKPYRSSKKRWHLQVNWPLPESFPDLTACSM
jgi:hypothetical protein